jgi:hypothetical protein
MKGKLLILLSCLIANVAFAVGDTTKVLFIGNSFTFVEDVPGLVKGLSDKAGHPFSFFMHAPGGISVGDVGQGTDAHMNNPIVYDAIRASNWDFVVIQDNQGRFVDGGGIFPSPNASKVIEGHLKLRDSIRRYLPCARTLWFSGWAWKDGYTGLGTGEDLIRNIYENYRVLNDTAHEIIVPIGSAWLYAMQALPAVDLWSADRAHQSLAGSYVTASTIYSSIFRKDPENIPFDGGLDTAVARQLRKLGYRAVIDSFTNSGLNNFVPVVTQSGTQLVATAGGGFYEWYKNGVLLAGNANTITISGNGTYQVIVRNLNCTSRSMAIVVGNASGVGAVAVRNDISLFPNPVQNDLTIKLKGNQGELLSMTISDATGSVVHRQSFRQATTVAFHQLPAGVYFVSISGDNGGYVGRVVKN